MTGESGGPLLSEARELMIEDTGNAEVLSTIFASVFNSKMSLQESQVPETKGSHCSKEDAPLVGESRKTSAN